MNDTNAKFFPLISTRPCSHECCPLQTICTTLVYGVFTFLQFAKKLATTDHDGYR